MRFKGVRPSYVAPKCHCPLRLWLADVRVRAPNFAHPLQARGTRTYFQTCSAVMSISIQPWHGPLKMSVCMTPARVPLVWGV